MQENNLQSRSEYIHFKLGLNYPKDFTIHDVLIISRILSFQLNNKTYYESQNNLAKHLLTTRQLINRRIQFLIKQGWLVKDKSTIGETIFLSVAIDKLDNLSHYVTGGCNDILQGGVTDCDRGCNAVLHKNKHIIQDNNKGESKDVTANASTNLPLEIKPYLTLEQIKETYKDNIYLDSIVKWYEYKINRKESYTSISYIKTSLKKHGSNFPIAVNDSIQRNKQGIYLYSKPKAPRQEWQIKKDIEPKTIILFNDLFFSKLDLENFFEICKNSDLKTELKKYMEFRNIKSLKAFNDYFLAIDSEKSQLYNTRLKDFTSSLTNFAVKREMAVQTN